MDLAESICLFSDDLFKEVNLINEKQNFFLSPFALASSLSILINGTRGESRDQLVDALHLVSHFEVDALNAFCHNFIYSCNNIRITSQKLSINNLTLISSKHEVKGDFEAIVTGKYCGRLDKVDFMITGDKVVHEANDWVTQSTNGAVAEILAQPPFHNTLFILLNTLYFESKWLFKFSPQTYESTFLVNDQNGEKVTFMSVAKQFCYQEISFGSTCEAVKMVEVPYEGYLSMIILLPPKSTRVNAVIASHSISELIYKFREKKTHRFVDLHMPKFKLDTRTQMNDILAKLGISDIFSSKAADFSAISDTEGLFLSSLIHAASFEVSEEGTTVTSDAERYFPPEDVGRPIKLILDRPFVFVIYEHVADLPLFIGKICKPQVQT